LDELNIQGSGERLARKEMLIVEVGSIVKGSREQREKRGTATGTRGRVQLWKLKSV
jgi:hypothetical protein